MHNHYYGMIFVSKLHATFDSQFVIASFNVLAYNKRYSWNSSASIATKSSALIRVGCSNSDIVNFALCLGTSSKLQSSKIMIFNASFTILYIVVTIAVIYSHSSSHIHQIRFHKYHEGKSLPHMDIYNLVMFVVVF